MMTKKTLASLGAAAVLVFGAAACADDDGDTTVPDPGETNQGLDSDPGADDGQVDTGDTGGMGDPGGTDGVSGGLEPGGN